MLGGLYGDLPPPSSSGEDDNNKPTITSTTNVWSSSAKMAPPTLRKPFPPPQTFTRIQPKPKPQPQAQPSFKPVPTISIVDENTNVNQTASFQPALVGVTSSVMEEYDPARPNDYEEYCRERKRKQMEADMRREMEERQRKEREREEREIRERDREKERDLNISGEEAWRRRAAMSGQSGGARVAPPPPPRSPSPPGNNDFSIGKSDSGGLGLGAEGKMTAAQRMMAKMGWKEGQGLGKLEQGITTPLMVKKTDKRAGNIVNESENKKLAEKAVNSVQFNTAPTRVVLLRNMVGPGEVDDDLQSEVAEECSKFGTVTRVLIFEITKPNIPHEEAVRIFVQFERSEEATKALIELEGRFFGGRIVRTGFFDEEKFSKNELAPSPGEIPGFS